MVEKLYTQAEADALIAGAYEKIKNKLLGLSWIPLFHRQDILRNIELVLTPDAARLALASHDEEIVRAALKMAAGLASKMRDAASAILEKGHDADAAAQFDTAEEIREAILDFSIPAILRQVKAGAASRSES